ncbi:MAG TPA: hypothetical protein VMU54_20520, partial [Planctomycetota bacterium]|nr:hypothetical protein [Planctomycetota bacterium]
PFLHPGYSAAFLLFDQGANSPVWNVAWIPATILSVFVGRFIVIRVVRPLEKRIYSPPHRGLAPDSELPVHPGAIPPTPGARPAPERTTREVWDRDPLLWKELLTRAGNRWTSEAKSLFLVYAVIFILLCWLFKRGESLGTFTFLGGLFSMLAVVNGASLFAPEKEGRKLDMLLSSPISSAAIIRSKLMAGLASPEAIRIGLLGIGTSVAFSWWSGAGVILYAGVFALFILFVFTLATTASLHAQTLQGAALATTGILCGIILVLPIVVSILVPAGTSPGSVPRVVFLLGSCNPYTVLEPLNRIGGPGTPVDALGRFLIFALVYGGSIVGLVTLMHLRFDRIMGRS